MKKSWTLDIGGARRRLDVDWDVATTGRGQAWVDGASVDRWSPGVKLPGVAVTFEVAGHPVTVRQSWFGFDLDLRASPDVRIVSGAPAYAGSGRNLTPRAARSIGIAIALAVVASVVAFALALTLSRPR